MISGIDVIIRLDDLSDLLRLEHALFAVFGQNQAVPIHVHLMVPRFSIDDLRRLRLMTEPIRQTSGDTTVSIHNWQRGKTLDIGVPILNWGIAVTTSRYFTILEVSDVLGAGVYAMLLNRLKGSDDAIVVAALIEQHVDWWGECFVPSTEAAGEPAVIFMLDRDRVAFSDLVFTPGEPGGEVARFIEAIRRRYRTEPGLHRPVIGVRQLPN